MSISIAAGLALPVLCTVLTIFVANFSKFDGLVKWKVGREGLEFTLDTRKPSDDNGGDDTKNK